MRFDIAAERLSSVIVINWHIQMFTFLYCENNRFEIFFSKWAQFQAYRDVMNINFKCWLQIRHDVLIYTACVSISAVMNIYQTYRYFEIRCNMEIQYFTSGILMTRKWIQFKSKYEICIMYQIVCIFAWLYM